MMKVNPITVAAAIVVLGLPISTGVPRAAAERPTPILVELFTSEGCSSCPPADTFLQRLIDAPPRPDVQVIGLGHHVDYWDHQGWRDRFSSSALTARQQVYGDALHVEAIYTPQMIADGRLQFVGSDVAAGRQAIDRAAVQPHGTLDLDVQALSPTRASVRIAARDLPAVGRRDHADFVVAIAEDGLQSNVRAGENRGRTLTHAAVVRRLLIIGEALGDRPSARTDFGLEKEWQRERVKVVAFVQERSSRRVLATRSVPLQGSPR